MTDTASSAPDIIDGVVPLAEGHPVHAVRHERAKVVAATQASYEALFSPEVQGIPVTERLLIALHACRLSGADSLATLYRARLAAAGADRALVDAVDGGKAPFPADERMAAMLDFTGKLILKPIDGNRAAVESLQAVGLGTPAIVAMGQLIAFLSYQIRVAAGLKAMVAATSGTTA